jgi:hypothetical protein
MDDQGRMMIFSQKQKNGWDLHPRQGRHTPRAFKIQCSCVIYDKLILLSFVCRLLGRITNGDAVSRITNGDAVSRITNGDAVSRITNGDAVSRITSGGHGWGCEW